MNQAEVLRQEKVAYARVEPPCPYFGTCGGCSLQDLAYADQLALKRERLQRALAPLGALPPCELVGLEDPWRYRNKAEFTFGESGGQLVLGYHAARSFWRIVALEDCLLLPEPAMRVVRDVCALARSSGLPAYQPRTHQGFFRYCLLRHSHATGRILVCLMTAPGHREVIEGVAQELMARHPEVVSVYWGITSRVADIAVPDELIRLRGVEYLEDRLGPFRVWLHPLSVLQPSHVQAERMYALVSEAAGRVSGGVAWDLYCGVGLIAFYLARRCQKVYGVDAEARHVALAGLNASLNGLDNLEFRTGRVESLLMDRRFWLQEAKPDVVAVDPPRAGLHAQALSSIAAARPKAILYLSCNAQSLVRDLGLFCSGFPPYRITQLHAFDMFPQTNHVEIFTFLERGG